ncbi:DUF6748 domain-containing protein [Polyangium aurulentum]|uniref:DUF6748 domain-containing protein n=1 Tax=Polyangium aurulentum TaxID=2567896 RepID=UPI0010ADF43B|nr:DUF6748 domain-containing protein [Polyangium aurulentum]UQA60098.1 hypothetical protein E8A73_006330 [Polyangium aurulentum]
MSPRRILALFSLAICSPFYAAGCAGPDLDPELDLEEDTAETAEAVTTATYYTARYDVRRCAAPMCGGYFVSAVNQAETECADGTRGSECYVADLDLSWFRHNAFGQNALRDAIGPRREDTRVVLFGDLDSGSTGYGTLTVRSAWIAPQRVAYVGEFYKARFNDLVCVVAPCPSFDAETLNVKDLQQIHEVKLSEVRASERERQDASQALFARSGIIVAGRLAVIPEYGRGGAATVLEGSQFFLPLSRRSR